MPLPSDATQQALLVTMLGDVPTTAYPSGILQGTIASLWALHSDALNAAVKFLLVKRDAVDLLIGTIRLDVTFRADTLTVNLRDKLKALLAMRPTDADLMRAYKVSQGSGYASGTLKNTTPSVPPYVYPDANDPRYAGTPYRWPWPWNVTGY